MENRGFFSHTRPKFVAEKQLAITNTFALGGLAVLMVFMLYLSGFVLSAFFDFKVPMNSLKEIKQALPYGWYFADVHNLSSQALLVFAVLHLFRNSLKDEIPAMTWITGCVLFKLLFLSLMTGYFLRGDVKAELAKIVFSNFLRLHVPTSILYILHVSVLPVMIVPVSMWHFYYVRKSNTARFRLQPKVSVVHLYETEAIAALVGISVMNALVLFVSKQPLPKSIANDVEKAVWFFRPFQKLLQIAPPNTATIIISFVFLYIGMFPFARRKIGKLPATLFLTVILLLCVISII